MSHSPLPLDTIRRLAPPDVVSHRASRAIGDAVQVSLQSFAPDDQAALRYLYATLLDLLALLESRRDQDNGHHEVVAFAEERGWSGLLRTVQRIGAATLPDRQSPTLRAVVHDVRGGSLQALSIAVQLALLGRVEEANTQRLFFLTRDHLKIMRNAIPDLDPPRYSRDMTHNLHSAALLVEKWTNATHMLEAASARVIIDSHFDGNVSERCIEFAALDRVIYNLINNAARFASDGAVHLVILPVGAQGRDLRFAIANRVTDEQQATLRDRFGDDLGALFRGGFTTGGNGLGLRICADFVADAYGVRSIDAAIAESYLGARLIDGRFVSWFHWPVAAD